MPTDLTPEQAAKKFAKKTPAADPAVQPIAAIPAPAGAHSKAKETSGRERASLEPDITPGSVPPPAGGNENIEHPTSNVQQRTEGTLAPPGNWQLAGKDSVIPRVDNPRRINEKTASFKDLIESIRCAGIITPLLGRPHPVKKGCIELLAGHRRRLAGLAAGLTEFPIVVREMDDKTAVEVLVFENLDRENLSPMEEARGVDLLLKSNHAPADIAARMGKAPQWVARRASLLTLTAQWQGFAEDHGITAAHLELIARCSKATQDELLQLLYHDHARGRYFTGPSSLKDLRGYIANELMELKQAPWKLDNTVLVPKAGACETCPKRSGCHADLFDEGLDGKGDRCLDRQCWKAKHAAYRKLREAELRKEHKDLVLIKGQGYDYDEVQGLKTLDSYQFTECKQSTAGAKPALIVSGKGQGSLTWIKMGSGGGGTRESAAKKKGSAAGKQAAASLDPKASAKLLKEKQEAHELRRWAGVCGHLQEMLEENELPVHPEMRSPAALCHLVRIFGADDGHADGDEDNDGGWDRLMNVQPGGIETLQVMWRMVRARLKSRLQVYTVSSLREEHHEAIKGCAWLLGVTVEELKAQADTEIPEPKSWNALKKLTEAPATKGKETKAKEPKAQKPKGPKKEKPGKKTRAGKMAAAGDESDDETTWTPEKEKTNKAAGKKKGRKAA